MSLSKKSPIVPPNIMRQDLANAIVDAPSKAMQYLSWAEKQLQYLGDALPADEEVLAAASSTLLRCTRAAFCGAIVVTPNIENGHNLGSWMNNQRAALDKGTITVEKVAELDAIDPAWRRGKLTVWEQEAVAAAA
ncbi:helicase associated domain-containing protein [Pseudarthrobacter sp. NPDC058196]|uniref:helicase associated domain-containing protein n=1 Tax=Pseudarthrobacter sp. NPDC058196 TaxID=3346376 RepID=UPI0036DE89C4